MRSAAQSSKSRSSASRESLSAICWIRSSGPIPVLDELACLDALPADVGAGLAFVRASRGDEYEVTLAHDRYAFVDRP